MLLITLYSLVLLSLSIYSYSQIDLNLTLSANSVYQNFQKQLIQLGYFNRPTSAAVFVSLIALLYIFYFIILHLVRKKKLSSKNIYLLIVASIVILFFSYPAFSHDIFNYMFDARMITKYQANPYLHKALDFPQDNWLRFMRWTHRTYPYGPVWLLTTLPFSFFSFGKFTISLFNFKLMFTLFHLGNIFLIKKILSKISPKEVMLGVCFYALNPLILIESLVSPHNEALMLFFLLLSFYLLFNKKNILAVASLLFSIGTKFITAILLPLFLIEAIQSHPDPESDSGEGSRPFSKISTGRMTKLTLLLLLIPLAYHIIIREPYPWYFIPFIGVGALLINCQNIKILLVGASLAFLLRYAPYLYRGDYSPETYYMQSLLFGGGIGLSLLWVGLRLVRDKCYNSHRLWIF